jgi:predicted phosphodiesterase
MRWGILGDIHANLAALETVLAALARERVDALYHVGDVVGYCADFGPVIERLQKEGVQGVVGNHELMVLGAMDPETANEPARSAAIHTREQISEGHRAYLAGLPLRRDEGDAVFFHAFPDRAEGYISRPDLAALAMAQLDQERDDWSIAFHGHTHKQRIFERAGDGIRLVRFGQGRVTMQPGTRYLVCPGSVGVSRDADSRAAYLLYDDAGVLEQRRVAYDWRATQARIAEAGLATRVYKPERGLAGRVRQFATRALGRG